MIGTLVIVGVVSAAGFLLHRASRPSRDWPTRNNDIAAWLKPDNPLALPPIIDSKDTIIKSRQRRRHVERIDARRRA